LLQAKDLHILQITVNAHTDLPQNHSFCKWSSECQSLPQEKNPVYNGCIDLNFPSICSWLEKNSNYGSTHGGV